MAKLLEKVILMSKSAATVTTVCGVLGAIFLYYVLFGKQKKVLVPEINTSRKIKQDVLNKQDKAITNDEVHTESKKASMETVKVDKHSEASVGYAIKPVPFLAQYEATNAMVLRDAANYRSTYLDNVKKREITARHVEMDAKTVAVVAGTASMEPDTEPKAPEPVLCSFDATTAATTLKTQTITDAVPIAPKPFLAVFDATIASTLFVARKYIAALPKASEPCPDARPMTSKPFLATYEATTASTQFEASQIIKDIVSAQAYNQAMNESLGNMEVKVAENIHILADYEATTAHCAEAAQRNVASLVSSHDYITSLEAYQGKQSIDCPQAIEKTLEKKSLILGNSPFCDSFTPHETATPSTTSAPGTCASDLTSYGECLDGLKSSTCIPQKLKKKEAALPAITTNLASLEATTAYHLLEQQKQQYHDHVEYYSDVEVEIKDNVLSSPSAFSSVSSTASSETGASGSRDNDKFLPTNTSKSQFDVSWDQMYASNNSKKPIVDESPKTAVPFISTVECLYYPNCTNKKCKFVHPGNDNNPKPKRASTIDAVSKKPWTKAERIERQSQTHFPTWKSRCVHWPYCTNNHCKYSHPIKECRMGEQCFYRDRCMFLHPSDFMEPAKKLHTLKRAQTQSLTQV
ncbi:hypothetical protein BD408DRAFT_415720 [Parasitella parasitica]|nr:hypothetical protein BD408DRAFT_415720 [Parasitella parasitica]